MKPTTVRVTCVACAHVAQVASDCTRWVCAECSLIQSRDARPSFAVVFRSPERTLETQALLVSDNLDRARRRYQGCRSMGQDVVIRRCYHDAGRIRLLQEVA